MTKRGKKYRLIVLTFRTVAKGPAKKSASPRRTVKTISPKTAKEQGYVPPPTVVGKSALKKTPSPERLTERPSSPRKTSEEPDYVTLWKTTFSETLPKGDLKEAYEDGIRTYDQLSKSPGMQFLYAVSQGWDSAVRILMKRVDEDDFYEGLKTAVDTKNEKILRLLLSSDRVKTDRSILEDILDFAREKSSRFTDIIKGYLHKPVAETPEPPTKPVSPRKATSPRRETGLAAEVYESPKKEISVKPVSPRKTVSEQQMGTMERDARADISFLKSNRDVTAGISPKKTSERPVSPRKTIPEERFTALWRGEFSQTLPPGDIQRAYADATHLMRSRDTNLKLMHAAESGWEMKVIDLVHQADDAGKIAALKAAMKHGKFESFEMILKLGNLRVADLTDLLIDAIRVNEPKYVRALLSTGAVYDQAEEQLFITKEVQGVFDEFGTKKVKEVPRDPSERAKSMMQAIKSVDENYLRELVDGNDEADQPISQEKLNNALFTAVEMNFPEAAEILLENGADVDVISKSQKFPDRMSIIVSHWRSKQIKETSPISPEAEKKLEELDEEEDEDEKNAEEESKISEFAEKYKKMNAYEQQITLTTAVREGDRVKFYAAVRDPNTSNYAKNEALEVAISLPDSAITSEFADVLLDSGAEISAISADDILKTTGELRKVLDSWAQKPSEGGSTFYGMKLADAAYEGRWDVVDKLLETNVDQESKNTALREFVRKNNLEYAEKLIKAGGKLENPAFYLKKATGPMKEFLEKAVEEFEKEKELKLQRPLTINEIKAMRGFDLSYGDDGWRKRYSNFVETLPDEELRSKMIKVETDLTGMKTNQERIDYLILESLEKRLALILPMVTLTKKQLDDYLLIAAGRGNTDLCLLLMKYGASPNRDILLRTAEFGHVETFKVLENTGTFSDEDLKHAFKLAVNHENTHLAYYLKSKVELPDEELDALFDAVTLERIKLILEDDLVIENLHDPLAEDSNLYDGFMGAEDLSEPLKDVKKAYEKREDGLGKWMRSMLVPEIVEKYQYTMESGNAEVEQIPSNEKVKADKDFEKYPPLPVNVLSYFSVSNENFTTGAKIKYNGPLMGELVLGMGITEDKESDDIIMEALIPKGTRVGFFPADFTVVLPAGTVFKVRKVVDQIYQFPGDQQGAISMHYKVAVVDI